MTQTVLMKPSGWPLRKLSDMSEKITVGFVGSMSHLFQETGVPLLRGQNIEPYKLKLDSLKYISEETHNKWRKSSLEPGDVAVVRVGYPGTACVIPQDAGPLNAASLVIIRTNPRELNPYYLSYVLNSDWGKQKITSRLVGAAQQVFNTKVAANMSIPAPPIDIQDKIADILGTLDEKIELNRKMNETLEQMGRALFRHYFIDNPEAERWDDSPVESLIDLALGGDWGKEDPDDKYTQKVRVIRGTDMGEIKVGSIANVPTRYVEDKKYVTRQLRAGDVLIEISGGSNTQPTGRSLYIDTATIDLLGGSVIPASFCRIIRAKSQEKASILFTFLEYLYDKGAMWDYQNRSTGISNFQFKFFIENAMIKTAPDHVEKAFYNKVQPIIKQRARNAQEIQTLTALRNTLLPRLISGKVKV